MTIRTRRMSVVTGFIQRTTKRPLDIHLNPLERNICDMLHKATLHLRLQDASKKHVELRIAGGWVRDKVFLISYHLYLFISIFV